MGVADDPLRRRMAAHATVLREIAHAVELPGLDWEWFANQLGGDDTAEVVTKAMAVAAQAFTIEVQRIAQGVAPPR